VLRISSGWNLPAKAASVNAEPMEYYNLINCFTPPELIGQQGFGNARADVRQEPATHLRFHRKPCASQTSPLTSSMILLD
jgi:hypothetical protein